MRSCRRNVLMLHLCNRKHSHNNKKENGHIWLLLLLYTLSTHCWGRQAECVCCRVKTHLFFSFLVRHFFQHVFFGLSLNCLCDPHHNTMCFYSSRLLSTGPGAFTCYYWAPPWSLLHHGNNPLSAKCVALLLILRWYDACVHCFSRISKGHTNYKHIIIIIICIGLMTWQYWLLDNMGFLLIHWMWLPNTISNTAKDILSVPFESAAPQQPQEGRF